MRKRTIKTIADTIFWYALYFLPVLAFLLYVWSGTSISLSFGEFVTSMGLELAVSNPIVSTLDSLFGATGVLPLFTSSTPIVIFGWFVSTYLLHLAVDFLLFIPRYAHKLLNDYTEAL